MKKDAKKKTPPTGRFLALSDAQKDVEVDRLVALPLSAWRPLSTPQRKQWNRIKRKMGRPNVGSGSR